LINWFDKFYKGEGSPDIYYSFGWAVSPIECNLGIIAASIPALWGLLRKAFPNLFSDLSTSYRVNNTHPSSNNRPTAFRSNVSRHKGASRLEDDDAYDGYMMKSMGTANGQADDRPTTPSGSQDGIIDVKNGIMRTTEVEIGYASAPKAGDRNKDSDAFTRGKNMAYAV
jgi:hypothetical protein